MKIALFAFNGDPMCFVHVLLNALDMKDKGHQVQVIVEGTATKLVKELHEDSSKPFAPLYQKVRDQGLIAGVCKACSGKTGSQESAVSQGLALLDDMSGHPGLAAYLDGGYHVTTL